MKLVLAAIVLCTSAVLAQHDPHFVDGRNTIVHLFEWKWSDIASECENWLSKKGFAGVQISPPSENAVVKGRPWWEKYQPVSYVLSNRCGDETALVDMIKRCNNVGVRIYVDLIMNHMATVTSLGTAGNNCKPDEKYYPSVPYSNKHFHPSCFLDYTNATSTRICELSGLKDLDQSQAYVRGRIVEYMNHLISLGIAGFRVDSAKNMWPSDLSAIFAKINNLSTKFFPRGSKPFLYQEIYDTDKGPVFNTEYTSFGRVCEFKHGLYLAYNFRGNDPMVHFINWGSEWGLLDGNYTLIFVDNHDTERASPGYLNYKEPKAYMAAIAFMLAHSYDGVTKILSSYYFDNIDQGPPADGDDILSPGFTSNGSCTNGWVCQHRWSSIVNMVEFRNVVAGTPLTNWWSGGDNQIAFSRGDKGLIAIAINDDINASVPTGLPDGTYCDVVSGSYVKGTCTGKNVTVSDGLANIQISVGDQEAAVAIHVNARL